MLRAFWPKSTLPTRDAERSAEFPSIEVNSGHDVDKVLIELGNFLVYSSVKADIAESAHLTFFLEMMKESLSRKWALTGHLDRMRIERACFSRFGIPLSCTSLVDPPVKEALVAYASIVAGIPPGIALKPLSDTIDEWENA